MKWLVVIAGAVALVLVGCDDTVGSSAEPAQRRVSPNTPRAISTPTQDIEAQRAHEVQVACLQGGGQWVSPQSLQSQLRRLGNLAPPPTLNTGEQPTLEEQWERTQRLRHNRAVDRAVKRLEMNPNGLCERPNR